MIHCQISIKIINEKNNKIQIQMMRYESRITDFEIKYRIYFLLNKE